MSESPTLYSYLHVTEDASIEVIKGAYKYLTQKYHPDKNPTEREKCEKMMKLLNEAYGILSDSKERLKYDELLKLERDRLQKEEQAKEERAREEKIKQEQARWYREHEARMRQEEKLKREKLYEEIINKSERILILPKRKIEEKIKKWTKDEQKFKQ